MQVNPELLCKIATDPGVNPALPIQKTLFVVNRKYAFVPDTGVNIQPLTAIAPQGNHFFWPEVVSRQGHRHDKGSILQWMEQLPPHPDDS